MNMRDRIQERAIDLEIMPVMCGTCPFRPGSPYANLAEGLAESAIVQGSRVCHSTGKDNAINPGDTGKPSALCRGARDVQLAVYAAIGYIEAATDEAWDKKCREIGLKK